MKQTTMDENSCKSLYSGLQAFHDVSVLVPVAFFDVTPAGLPPFPDQDGWKEQSFVGTCKNLDINRVYWKAGQARLGAFSHVLSSDLAEGFQIDSPSFNAKPQREKEAIADGYVQATRNIEIYDLSHYIGDGAWGYFGEGAIEHWLKGRNPFSTCQGPTFSSITVAKLFNSETCEMKSFKWFFSRVGFQTFGDAKWAGTYFAAGTIYGFVDISGKLYIVGIIPEDDQRSILSLTIMPISKLAGAGAEVCVLKH